MFISKLLADVKSWDPANVLRYDSITVHLSLGQIKDILGPATEKAPFLRLFSSLKFQTKKERHF